MGILFGFILLFMGLFTLALGIKLSVIPKNIYDQNHKITKEIKSGKYIDSDLVEDCLTYDERNGCLFLSQKLSVNAMKNNS